MGGRRLGRGLIYLRRSNSKQEASLETQLDWALGKAREQGIDVDASPADLQFMVNRKSNKYKSLRIDDAISGDCMDRPGFLALLQDAAEDKTISHIFVYRRDRLARPEDAMAMTSMERKVREKGVTIVFENRIAGPRQAGQGDPGDDLSAYIEYYQSGEYLKQLSARVIDGLRKRASQNAWTGGRPPYGFIRVLIDPQGNVVEELPDGRSVRQPGYRVGIQPKDPEKIRVWILILDLKKKGWGGKRIANHLNKVLGIPSPDAGRVRTDQKIRHFVSGKWGNRTVLDLCDNAAIIGLQEWGRRSEGKHRRLGPDGARHLNDEDRTTEGKLRLVNNDPSTIVRVEHGYEPLYDPSEWTKIRAATAERGKSQKGIPRSHDPAKYPLSCRVIDMTDECGAIMYGRENGKRRIYVCGRYSSTSGAECENNTVDAEALLELVAGTLQQQVLWLGGHGQLRTRLREIAQLESSQNAGNLSEQELAELQISRKRVEAKIHRAGGNLALAENDFERTLIRKQLAEYKQELEEIQRRQSVLESSKSTKIAISDDVDACLELFDQLLRVTSERSARLELIEIFQALNLRVGLNFTSGVKGKKRVIRTLTGGVIALGSGHLPVALHGKHRVTDEIHHNGSLEYESLSDPGQMELTKSKTAPETGRLPVQDATNLPFSRHEGVSFTKVSRGDRS